VSRDQSPVSSLSRLEQYKARYQQPRPQSRLTDVRSPETQQHGRRRPSYPEIKESSLSRSQYYRPSKLNNTYSSHDEDDETHIDTPPELVPHSKADETDSVVSASNPPTVWDELEGVKSRLRRMELNNYGKMPTTPEAANADRPRTATTAATTLSSSPHQARKSTGLANDVGVGGTAAQDIHPLLHSSLARCKTLLKPALYRPLEAAANQALQMAVTAGTAGPQGTAFSAASIINGQPVADRKYRRMAEDMCRNLTDLCIALTDPRDGLASQDLMSPGRRSTTARRGSNDSTTAPSQMMPTYSREGSLEPETIDRNTVAPSRALERIQARRSSLATLGSPSNNNSPRNRDNEDKESQVSDHTQTASRASRPGTSLLRARRTLNGSFHDESEDERRPVSRAATEVSSNLGRRRSHRLSRDYLPSSGVYTSKEPMPDMPDALSSPYINSSRRRSGLLEAQNSRRTSTALDVRYPSTRSTGLSSKKRHSDLGRSVRSVVGAD